MLILDFFSSEQANQPHTVLHLALDAGELLLALHQALEAGDVQEVLVLAGILLGSVEAPEPVRTEA